MHIAFTQQNIFIDSVNSTLNNESSRLKMQLSEVNSEIDNHTQQLNAVCLPATSSCAALPPFSPSGYYWVRASNGSAVPVYCDMTRWCVGVTGGWMRVAQLNMTDSSYQVESPDAFVGQIRCINTT